MTKTPQKPITKSSRITEVWTDSADDRIGEIEAQLIRIEKKLVNMANRLKKSRRSESKSLSYTVVKKS